jgi:hypothetical protein
MGNSPESAEVAEQADALRSGRSGLYARKGSTPFLGTNARSGFRLKSQNPFLVVAGQSLAVT